MKIKQIKSLKTSLKYLILGACLAGGNVFAQTLPLAPNLIGFDSPEGENLLLKSKSKDIFSP